VDRKEIFARIYSNMEWGNKETLSGEGTRPEAAEPYVNYLIDFLKSNAEIQKIVDVGCGDWKMWPNNFFSKYKYLGVDIVEKVVQENTAKFAAQDINFIAKDFLESSLPNADLLLCKDVLIHLSDSDIEKALVIFKKFRFQIIVTDLYSIGIRVFLGNLRRIFINPNKKIVDLPTNLISVFKNDYLSKDIATGSYHWVDLENKKYKIEQMEIRIVNKIDYTNKRLTFGRKTLKRIYLLENLSN
jgi:hypothetical protein